MSQFRDVIQHYSKNQSADARKRVSDIASYYSEKAAKIGYIPLTGATTIAGLSSLLLLSADESGIINESKLPAELIEAFRLQYPVVYESGGLNKLTPETAESYLNGWTGKYTEVLARNSLNRGESIGGFSLSDGETAVLASDPTQTGWDLMVEPTGRLLQVKSTESVAYVKETLNDLDGSGIDVLTTDLPTFDYDSSVMLMELDMTKGEIDDFFDAALLDAADDFGVDDLLGTFGLIFTAGSSYVLVKKIKNDLQQGKSISELYKNYGPRAVGRAINMISPIPFTGFLVSKFLKSRLLLSEAAKTVKERLTRAEKLISNMKANRYNV